LKKIEEESKEGNKISRRIFEQLNNHITNEKMVVLKCLKDILDTQKREN
jgi:hypothetical protein